MNFVRTSRQGVVNLLGTSVEFWNNSDITGKVYFEVWKEFHSVISNIYWRRKNEKRVWHLLTYCQTGFTKRPVGRTREFVKVNHRL